MSKGEAGILTRYGFAFSCLLLAFLFRESLDLLLGDQIPYAFFAPAAMLAAWFGGFGPGLLVLGLGVALGFFAFVSPHFAFGPVKAFELTVLLATVGPGFISIWIIELLRRARQRARAVAEDEIRHAERLRAEVAERTRAEEDMALMQRITRSLAEANTTVTALGAVLDEICRVSGWALGHAWLPSADRKHMTFSPHACACSPELRPFQEASAGMAFREGEGLVGHVWKTRQPLWVPNVQELSFFIRAVQAREVDIKAALVVPVCVDQTVVAILEFFLREAREQDGRLVTLISTAAEQLGVLIQRKQAEEELRESRRRLAESQELAHLGSWEWHPQSDILIWSDELCRLFGLPPEEFEGRYEAFFSRVHEDDQPLVRSVIDAALRNRRPFEYEHRIRRKDGAVRILHCRGRVVCDEEQVTKLTGTAQDITEQRQSQLELQRAQQKLRQHAATLERTVADRTSELQQSLKDMEGLLYTMAHDLRAPLRAITGFTDTLVEDYGGQFDDTARDFAQRIVIAARRMDRLITDLLEFGRLAHVQLPKELVPLDYLVEAAASRFTHEIRARKAQIEIEHPLPRVWGNQIALEQVLSNLLSNALKYVAPNVAPRIHLRAEESAGAVRVIVEDNGIGIPPEFKDRIFRPFERLHGATDYEGTGIGLAIASKAIERMGGEIGVDSEPGKGSRFWFELPKPPEAGSKEPQPELATASAG